MALPTLDITGNLTKDIELKFSGNGNAVASGTIAANKSKKGQGREWETVSTLFQPFTAFGADAEALASVGRGGGARLIGSLETQQWEDGQTGEKRSMTKLIVDFVRVFGRQNQGAFQQPQHGQHAYQQGGFTGSPEQAQQWGAPQSEAPF